MQPEAGGSDVMFPVRARGRSNSGAEAKALCSSCPVLTECLVASLERREKFGIWGGAGEKDRRALLRVWRDRPHPEGWLPSCSCPSCITIGQHVGAVEVGRPSRFNSNGPNATHGRASTYNRGCHCDACSLGRAMHDTELAAGEPPTAWWTEQREAVAA